MSKNTVKLAVAALAVIVIVVAGVLLLSSGTQPAVTSTTSILSGATTTIPAGTGALSIQLTDPPTVPPGTQALVIAYTGVGLHEAGVTNSTGYVNFSASGTVNLMNLTNVSQTIAVVQTESNQTFNMIRFDIKSATITIDNVTYNVTVPSGGVFASINNSVSASSGGGVLFDLSPTVVQIYATANQDVFVLSPSARAVVIAKSVLIASAGLHAGSTAVLPEALAIAVHARRSDTLITSASASEAGNLTKVHVTVTNTGNSSVVLSDVSITGYMEAIPGYGNWLPPPTVTVSPMVPPALNLSVGLGAEVAVSAGPLNSSLNSAIIADVKGGAIGVGEASSSTQLGINAAEIFYRNFHDQLNFVVDSNGTLQLPFAVPMVACPSIEIVGGNASAVTSACPRQYLGYTLAPGASVSLNYSGVISFPDLVVVSSNTTESTGGVAATSAIWSGPRAGSSVIVLIPNQTYRLVVHDRYGGSASTNVTATGYITNYTSKIVDVTSVKVGLHNTVTGATYNETMAGFLAHVNSTVEYTIYSYGGIYATALPNIPYSYGLNVTGFQVNTAGFTLVNYSVIYTPSPACPVCKPGAGTACPEYVCRIGAGKLYLLHIRVPPTSYTGTLSITEDYNGVLNTNGVLNAT